MEELRAEVSVKESLRRKLVGSQLTWAGHVERMEDELLTKRSDALRVQGRRRRGLPRLRWEDCVKSGLAVVGGEGRGGEGRGGENEVEVWGMDNVGGDGNETGSVKKKKGKQKPAHH